MIDLVGISHKYKSTTLFKDLSISIAQGEKVAITGPSGTGKSTILNFIMGFVKPGSGYLKFKGENYSPKNITAIRNNIAWLPQDYNSLGAGNTLDVINSPFGYKINKHLMPGREKIESYFEAVGLNIKHLESDFNELSGGEKQRVGAVICKLLERPLIILDEPASSLDSESAQMAINFLFDENSTVISSAHNEKWISACNKILELGNVRS